MSTWNELDELKDPEDGQDMIRISERRLRKELAEAERESDSYPGAWPPLEKVARCLHWLRKPDAERYFRAAAMAYRPRPDDATGLMSVGNYHRFVGDGTVAAQYFEHARSVLKRSLGDPYSRDVCQAIECNFLLGDYAPAEALVELLQTADAEPRSRGYLVARLARARRRGDASMSIAVADDTARLIRAKRVRPSSIAYLSLWDWYEIALEPIPEPAVQRRAVGADGRGRSPHS